ncbi:MAG: hypothetical protein AB1500_05780 [Bacillota bacterium]
MAEPSCPKCGKTGFEVLENKPLNMDYKLLFIRCASCGAVVGAVDLYNIASLFCELEQKLSEKLDDVEATVSDIRYKLNLLLARLKLM